MKSLSSLTDRLQGQPMFQILKKAKELERQGREILHFELGDPDFKTDLNVQYAAVKAMVGGYTHYVPSGGMIELKEAAADVTERSRGFRPSMDQLLVTPGANAAIYYALAAICNPNRTHDDNVVIPSPGFVSYYSICNMLDIYYRTVHLRQEDGFKLQAFDVINASSMNTKAIIINSPSNPTGAAMTPEEIKKIYDFCEKRDLYIISDEIYARMIYDDVPFSSPSQYDHCKERVIVINGFSKSFAMTGWRLGVVTGPEEVIQKMTLILETIQSCVPPFIQLAGAEALRNERSQEYAMSMVAEYKKRRDVMVDGLNSLPGVKCLKPEGAFYCFPDISGTGMDDWTFADTMLEKAGVALSPGSLFGNARNNVRLCYANSVQNIEKAIERMRGVL